MIALVVLAFIPANSVSDLCAMLLCTASAPARRGAHAGTAGVATNSHSKDEFARLVLSCVPGQSAFPVAAQWFDQGVRSSSEV